MRSPLHHRKLMCVEDCHGERVQVIMEAKTMNPPHLTPAWLRIGLLLLLAVLGVATAASAAVQRAGRISQAIRRRHEDRACQH